MGACSWAPVAGPTGREKLPFRGASAGDSRGYFDPPIRPIFW
jgi:hypothetical protein